jgi:hypothetical protein
MQHIKAAAWLALFVLSAHAGMGQASTRENKTEKATVSAPIGLSPLFMLNMLPQRVSMDDSLDRAVHARNQVKTVTLMRQRPGRAPDTAEYYTLDQRGNKVLVAKPYFGQHQEHHFDKQGRLVEIVMMPTADFNISSRLNYDPESRLHTTQVTVGNGAPVLWQQAQKGRRGDTLTTDAVFQPVAGMEAGPTRRLQMKEYRIGADTTCIEIVGYNSTNQLTDFTAYYNVKQSGRLIEIGDLSFGSTSSDAKAAGMAAELMRLRRHERGRFIPNTRNVYDAQGRLIQTTYISNPKAVTYTTTASGSTDGRTTTFSQGPTTVTAGNSSPLASATSRYHRTADGRVQREERTYTLRPGTTDPNVLKAFKPSSIDYEYGANGLLLRKTDSAGTLIGQPTVCEAKYTYY